MTPFSAPFRHLSRPGPGLSGYRALVPVFLPILVHGWVHAQNLGGFPLADHLVTAVHPNGCDPSFVTGPPDDKTWVNFNAFDMMTGRFGSIWTNDTGPDLLLETSYHVDAYRVRLLLVDSTYSAIRLVDFPDWTRISDTAWLHLDGSCTIGMQSPDRFIAPLDFVTDFGLEPWQGVMGVEITFLPTTGAPDLAGAYIIREHPCESVPLGEDTTLCAGTSLLLDATAQDATYRWQDGSTSPTFNTDGPGLYWVAVTVAGCTSIRTIGIDVAPAPEIHLGDDLSNCPGDDDTILDASWPNASYLWQDGSSEPTYTVSSPGIYWVEVRSGNCPASDTLRVTRGACGMTLEFPNVFSPNGDGWNDSFGALVHEGVEDYLLSIFNRWGQLIHKSTTVGDRWDGTANGSPCPDGTYFYTVVAGDIQGEQATIHGSLQLIR